MTDTVAHPERLALLRSLTPPLRLRYTPVTPTPKQHAFLTLKNKEVFFGGAAGGGKAHSLDAMLPTPMGWTAMKDIHRGFMVFDHEGQPRRVTWAGPVQFGRPCVRVTFSDGATIICDEEHEWPTFTYLDREKARHRTDEFRVARRATRPSRATGRNLRPHVAAVNTAREYEYLAPPEWKPREAREIAATLQHRGRTNHSIPIAAPLDLPLVDLSLDPYTLGAWLGDGTTRHPHISCHEKDVEIIDEIRRAGWPVRRTGIFSWTIGEMVDGVRKNGWRGKVNAFAAMLRELGVWDNKHIPQTYLRASFEQRLALLQGIVDTDGHVDRRDGRIDITLTRWPLVHGVCELLATLGIRYGVNEGRATLYGRDIGPRWRICFQSGHQCARLCRKADAQHRGPFRAHHDHRYIVSVESVPSIPVRCIEVEGGIYLVGERMIPTHNSFSLLMAALQYADVPGYAALILRKSFADLSLPGALMEVAQEWLGATDARWHDNTHTWSFPGGGTLTFGYLEGPRDRYRYQSAAFEFLAFDELTHFRESDYTYLFSRCRRPKGALKGLAPDGMGIHQVPLRVRSASNPGGVGHDWCYGRFIDDETRRPGAVFMPAKLTENEHLDYDAYVAMLAELGSVDRLRLLEGDWEASDEGAVFKREWFHRGEDAACGRTIRYWDTAATEVSDSNRDPDYTVGVLMGRRGDGKFVIKDVRRAQLSPGKTDDLILETTQNDGHAVEVWIQREPGSASKILHYHYAKLLPGYTVKEHPVGRTDGDKQTRAKPWAAALENGLVEYLPGHWIHEYISEHAGFPSRVHDDQVDASAGAHYILSRREGGTRRSQSPVGVGRIPRQVDRISR